MNIKTSKYKQQIGKYFEHSFNFDFLDIVANILEDIDIESDDFEDDIFAAIDENTVYTGEEWTIIKWYCSPSTASLDNAKNDLYEDIRNLCVLIRKGK